MNMSGPQVRPGGHVSAGDTILAMPLKAAVAADEATIGICCDTHLALLLLQKVRRFLLPIIYRIIALKQRKLLINSALSDSLRTQAHSSAITAHICRRLSIPVRCGAKGSCRSSNASKWPSLRVRATYHNVLSLLTQSSTHTWAPCTALAEAHTAATSSVD